MGLLVINLKGRWFRYTTGFYKTAWLQYLKRNKLFSLKLNELLVVSLKSFCEVHDHFRTNMIISNNPIILEYLD